VAEGHEKQPNDLYFTPKKKFLENMQNRLAASCALRAPGQQVVRATLTRT
jgi:hypothetical protein